MTGLEGPQEALEAPEKPKSGSCTHPLEASGSTRWSVVVTVSTTLRRLAGLRFPIQCIYMIIGEAMLMELETVGIRRVCTDSLNGFPPHVR